MRTLLLALIALTCAKANAARTNLLAVTERNGAAFVSAADLERGAAIAVKKLPGNALVACSEDRCATVKTFFREDDLTWVSVAELAAALGYTARFSEDKRQVCFDPGQKPAAESSVTGIGDLAPNFRLARLDGRPISLSDFRGKRVLIQSWASW